MPSASSSSVGRASLVAYLEASAARFPERTAVVGPGGERLTYSQLHAHASRLAGFLVARGVRPGDRVGLLSPKNGVAIAALFGILRAGGAYIPIDREAPAERIRSILDDSGLRALVVDAGDLHLLRAGSGQGAPETVVVVGASPAEIATVDPAGAVAWSEVLEHPPLDDGVPAPEGDDLAYILYTSGSTGTPKGVVLSHRNAMGFVDWCSEAFNPTEDDRFSSHAPLHFDLSVFDVFVCLKHGGTLFLIPEALGRSPRELARFIADNRLTVWYSTPSTLSLLAEFGDLPRLDFRALRLVLFAGEVFPVKHLRRLVDLWPEPEYFNLYGPTETNVCTWAPIPTPVPPSRTVPYPIGPACSHCFPLVLDDNGDPVPEGGEGLLHISGPSVFSGYWNRPAENAAAFVERDGTRWYNTGDLVRWVPDEGFVYLGRKDRMVKRRGYRVELGEVESCLHRHPAVRETAAVAVPDAEAGTRIVAFFAARTQPAPGMIELKTFCSQHLPSYMSPDLFLALDALPRTSTGKVDYQALGRLAHPRRQPGPGPNLRGAMDFELSDEHRSLQESAITFARSLEQADIQHRDREGRFSPDLWKRLADFGVLAMPIPEEHGGLGLGLTPLIAVMEGLGYGIEDRGLLFSMNAHLWTASIPILVYGTDEQRRTYLPGLCSGELIAANAATEPDAGSDVFSMRTLATRQGEMYVLNGAKTFVTNAPIAHLIVTYATIDRSLGAMGVTAFIVERDRAGLSLGAGLEKMGLRTSPMAELWLEDCQVPVSARLGREGRGVEVFECSMTWERGCILACYLGLMRRRLELCIEHARTRRQFGQPIGKFQSVANRIVDMKVRLETCRPLVYRVGWLLDRGQPAALEAAIAKLHVSECLVQSSLDAVQIFGGYGYMAEYQIERELRDAIGSRIYSGTSEIQRNIIARQLGI